MSNYDNNIFEGIGNEVLWSLSGIIGVTLGSYFMFQKFYGTFNFFNETNNQPAPADYLSTRFLDNADSNMNNITHFGSDFQCPVCLNEPRYPVETNCGHLFCAQCLILYWRHGNWLGAIRCPVCRQTVTVLLRCFRDSSELSTEAREEQDQILFDINDYNRHFSGEPRSLGDILRDLPTLLRHVGSEFFSFGGLIFMFRLRIFLCFLAAIMYLISPLDMIPEAIFGILGFFDDMFVVLLLAIYVTIIYRRFLATRWQNS